MSELMNKVSVDEVKVEDVDLNNVFGNAAESGVDLKDLDELADELADEGFSTAEIAAMVAAGVATGVGLYLLWKYVLKEKFQKSREKRKAKREAKRKSKIIEGKFKNVEDDEEEKETEE